MSVMTHSDEEYSKLQASLMMAYNNTQSGRGLNRHLVANALDVRGDSQEAYNEAVTEFVARIRRLNHMTFDNRYAHHGETVEQDAKPWGDVDWSAAGLGFESTREIIDFLESVDYNTYTRFRAESSQTHQWARAVKQQLKDVLLNVMRAFVRSRDTVRA